MCCVYLCMWVGAQMRAGGRGKWKAALDSPKLSYRQL